MGAIVCPISKRQTLMVASDGSDFSTNAIQQAIYLAKLCSSRLIAISVIKTNLEFESVLPHIVEKEEEEAYKHLEAAKGKAAEEGVECEIIVTLGEEPYQDIIYHAERNNVDMIIMGTHGRTGLKRLMMGSVTAKVIGHAPCNILVFPLHASIECRHVLIATDGSPYSEAAASEALGIAKRCGSPLTVVSVASSPEEMAAAERNVKSVSAVAEKEEIRVEEVVTIGKAYQAIVDTAQQKGADIIVVGSHGRTGLERLLMGSVTERVIGHSTVAVLVVKKPR